MVELGIPVSKKIQFSIGFGLKSTLKESELRNTTSLDTMLKTELIINPWKDE